MKNKRVANPAEAVSGVFDGATVLIGGFGLGGLPEALLDALCDRKVRGLTIVNNNSGHGETGIGRLIGEGCVAKVICSFPTSKAAYVFKEWFEAGKIEVEVVPQGTLAERIRCGGAGLGGFLTRTGLGTEIAENKKVVAVNGREYLLEQPLRGDFALVEADLVDPRGNLTYRMAARNFNPVMATAADQVLVQANREVGLGDIDPAVVITPGLFVDRYCIVDSVAKTPARAG
ncbi:MAG: 3-oxoacid CoA-transferase subunit A [Betaproteobacteria bacterium]|nr:3-oxoacid CoA-transferase subunit A [Betaproteobacteria bacterium]